jgi:hypothetical protein
MKQLSKFISLAILLFSLLLSCSKDDNKLGKAEKLDGKAILEWNEIAFRAFDGPNYLHSLMASRINAMMHIAMHDAVNAVQPKYETYAFNGKDAEADAIAAAVSAAYHVLVTEIPAKKPYLDSVLNVSLLAINDGEAKVRGIELGKQAALAIIANRANDGSAIEVVGAIKPSEIAGVYQAVSPFTFLFAPQWQNVKLFSLQAKDQFRSAPHPALTSHEYADALNEVKETGKLNSATRTPEQTSYAKFWFEFSEAGWNRVARTAAINKKLNLLEAARLFALVDMAIADAYTAGWDSKMHYNFWRPYTAIRNASIDSNPFTDQDELWEPSEPTPPVQDYPSTHSALGNAGAVVLAKLLGDNTPFTMTSFTAVPAGSTRTFNSFSQAAAENADSRVRAGIHFRFACDAGMELGKKIGEWTVENKLRLVE